MFNASPLAAAISRSQQETFDDCVRAMTVTERTRFLELIRGGAVMRALEAEQKRKAAAQLLVDKRARAVSR